MMVLLGWNDVIPMRTSNAGNVMRLNAVFCFITKYKINL